MITFVDITERKKSIETLSRMAAIIANSEEAIISKTLDGIIQTWNPGASKMLGHAEKDAIGRPFGPLILPPDQREVEREIRAGIGRGESAQTFETQFLHKDGWRIQVSATASPLLDAGGKAVGVSLIARDMTDRRAAEQALRERDAAEEASRLKSEFLATMSHELRTPLTGVIGFAEYLRAGQAGPINDEQAECLDSVHASSLHLLELINGILDLSKIEAGKMELTPEAFSVRAAVEEARGMVLPMAGKKDILLAHRVADSLSSVTLDRVKFIQVLNNLMSNGVKFTDAGGRVDIDVDMPENLRLRIRVADTGIGIRAEDIGQLFKTFHQLDRGDARRNEGAGLGLALTRKIVELQHGTITVESTPGQGSVFTVTLPTA
jgi:PAS domain S-box-containing protein